MSTHHPFFLIWFGLFSAARLAAQGEPASWSLRLAAIDIAGDHHTLWLRTGEGKKAIAIPLNTRVFCQPLIYKGPAALAFYRSAEEASAKEPTAPLATATLKTSPSLLVFSPKPDQKTYDAFAIADADFPFGSFRLVNFASATIRAELLNKLVILKSGAAETFVAPTGGGSMPVRILALAADTAPRVVRQSQWSLVPTQRELVLFFPNPQNGLVRLRHFVDTKEEEAKEE